MAFDPTTVGEELEAKGARHACPECGSDRRVVSDKLDRLVNVDKSAVPAQISGDGHDVIAVACRDCGFVRLYNAAIVGL